MSRNQYYRLLRAGKQRLHLWLQSALAPDHFEVPHHHSKRLHRARLQLSEALDRCFASGVAAEVETADSLDGGDAAIPDHSPGF